jgi:basic amino acid/polyamine antiporter, APA family
MAQVAVRRPAAEVFTRKSSGLVRVMSPYSAFVYNILTMGLIFPWTYVWAPTALPGGSLVWGIILATLFEIPIAFAYVWLSTAMPRSGGDYVFQSRVLGGGLGFTIVLSGFVIWILQWVALSGWLLALLGLAPLALGMGVALSSPALIAFGIWCTTATGVVVISVVNALLSLVLLVSGFKNYVRFQHVMWIGTLLAFGTMLLVFFTTSQQAFVAGLNNFAQAIGGTPNFYQNAVAAAQGAGADFSPPFSLLATLLVAPIAWTSLQWATYSAQQNGEIKDARSFRSQTFVFVGSLIVTGALLVLLALGLQAAIGQEGLTVASSGFWLALADSKIAGSIPLLPNILAVAMNTSPLIVLLIGVGYILNSFQIVCNCYIGVTRIMVGMSLDRLLPAWFSETNERWHTPVNAHLAYFLLSIPVILAYNYIASWAGLTLGVTFACGYVFVATCIAGALLPYRAKALYEASPGSKYTLGGVPLVTVLGGVGALFGVLMVLAFLFAPQLGILGNWNFEDFPANLWAQIVTIGIIVFAVVWYFVARAVQAGRGINVDYAFKEIPPE